MDYKIHQYQTDQNRSTTAGNRTPVSRVTGEDTYHHTTEDVELEIKIKVFSPSHPTEIQVKTTLTKPGLPFLFQALAMRMRVSQNKVSFLSSLEKKKVNMYKIFSSHLANFSPKKPKKEP